MQASGRNFRLQPNESKLSGELMNKDINFQYALNEEIEAFPESLEYLYLKSFRGYHYRKFFKELHVEPKLHKIFLDSIQLIQVDTIADGKTQGMLLSCNNCNVYADLKFKGKIFKYPLIISKEKVLVAQSYTFKQSLDNFPFITMMYWGLEESNKYYNGIYAIRQYKGDIKKTLIHQGSDSDRTNELSKRILSSIID